MRIRIQCFCGRILAVENTKAGATVICPQCQWTHPLPQTGHAASPEQKRTMPWLGPLIGNSCLAILVLLALLWALQMGGGKGEGGSGNGTGIGQGDGSGTGATGDGEGSGNASTGTGGNPSPGPPATQQAQAPRPLPTSEPATRPEDVSLAILDIKKPPPPPPAPPTGSTGGREGASGGGGFGKGGTGKDPGAKGDVSFTLIWTYTIANQGILNSGGPDVDIWVTDPKGNTINTSQEGSTRMGPTAEGGHADIDDRGGHGQIRSRGGGPERIFWPDGQAPAGKYRYGVRWFAGVGEARYTLRVYLGKNLVQTKTGLLNETDKGNNLELGTIETVKE